MMSVNVLHEKLVERADAKLKAEIAAALAPLREFQKSNVNFGESQYVKVRVNSQEGTIYFDTVLKNVEDYLTATLGARRHQVEIDEFLADVNDLKTRVEHVAELVE